jgi:hypothetical protein
MIKNKIMKKLSVKKAKGCYIQLQNEDVHKVVEVFIKDENAYILLSNCKWYVFLKDEYIDCEDE